MNQFSRVSPPRARYSLDGSGQSALLDRGLERCRSGDWDLGVQDLLAVSQEGRRRDLPSLLYSYLGYALARSHGDVNRGLRFCRRAIRLEFYQPENYLNLARTLLLSGDRHAAHQAVEQGLQFDPLHGDLLELRYDLGARREPVLRFLSRRNLLNRLLGRLRHDLTRSTLPPVTPQPFAPSESHH